LNRIGVILSRPPYGLEDAFAGARLSLSVLANGAESPVFLLEGGVLNGKMGQQSDAIGLPSNLDALEDLLGMAGEVYCVKEHLAEWRIREDDVLEGIEVVSLELATELIDCCDGIITF